MSQSPDKPVILNNDRTQWTSFPPLQHPDSQGHNFQKTKIDDNAFSNALLLNYSPTLKDNQENSLYSLDSPKKAIQNQQQPLNQSYSSMTMNDYLSKDLIQKIDQLSPIRAKQVPVTRISDVCLITCEEDPYNSSNEEINTDDNPGNRNNNNSINNNIYNQNKEITEMIQDHPRAANAEDKATDDLDNGGGFNYIIDNEPEKDKNILKDNPEYLNLGKLMNPINTTKEDLKLNKSYNIIGNDISRENIIIPAFKFSNDNWNAPYNNKGKKNNQIFSYFSSTSRHLIEEKDKTDSRAKLNVSHNYIRKSSVISLGSHCPDYNNMNIYFNQNNTVNDSNIVNKSSNSIKLQATPDGGVMNLHSNQEQLLYSDNTKNFGVVANVKNTPGSGMIVQQQNQRFIRAEEKNAARVTAGNATVNSVNDNVNNKEVQHEYRDANLTPTFNPVNNSSGNNMFYPYGNNVHPVQGQYNNNYFMSSNWINKGNVMYNNMVNHKVMNSVNSGNTMNTMKDINLNSQGNQPGEIKENCDDDYDDEEEDESDDENSTPIWKISSGSLMKHEMNPQDWTNNTNIIWPEQINNDFLTEMFGRVGWICQECNNFNYETRTKCNRCGVTKSPKKISDLKKKKDDEEKKDKKKNKGDWICPNCSNWNYGFRKMCNRCQIPRDPNVPSIAPTPITAGDHTNPKGVSNRSNINVLQPPIAMSNPEYILQNNMNQIHPNPLLNPMNSYQMMNMNSLNSLNNLNNMNNLNRNNMAFTPNFQPNQAPNFRMQWINNGQININYAQNNANNKNWINSGNSLNYNYGYK